jgi:hypothetical protein
MMRLKVTLAVVVAMVAAGSIGSAQWYGNVRRTQERERCAARVADLRAWLRALADEREVRSIPLPSPIDPDRFVDEKIPTMPMVRLGARPEPLPFVAAVWLDGGTLHFGPHTGNLEDVFRKVDASGLSPGFGHGGHGQFFWTHPVSLLAGENERWGDIAEVADAAARSDFAQIAFVFDVKSKVSPPMSAPPLERLLRVESDPIEMPYKRDEKAAAMLGADNPACPKLVAPFATAAHTNVEMDAQRDAFAAGAADAVADCACNVDVEEVRAFAWVRYGRHWGRTTASYMLDIAPRDRTKDGTNRAASSLSAPADAPWKRTYGRVIDAVEQKKRVYFLATPR